MTRVARVCPYWLLGLTVFGVFPAALAQERVSKPPVVIRSDEQIRKLGTEWGSNFAEGT